MAYETPLRKTFEEAGWQVKWQGSGKPIQVSYGGQTYNIGPDQYKIIGGSAYIDPNYAKQLVQQAGYQPVRSTLSPKYDISWDSGQVTVKHPTTGESYTFKPEFTIAGRTYTTPSMLETIQSRLTPAYETTYKDLSGMLANYTAQQQQYFQNYMNQINNIMKQYSDAGIAMLNAYQQQYSQALAQLQQLMQPQKDIPESVKIAINRLKEQTDENIKQLTEEMNRRGILQSGLAADMEAKLRKGALTEQQQLLANWLDQQHQQMFQAAMKMADMQAQYAANYANLYQQAYLKPLEMGLGIAETAYKTQAGLSQQAFDIASKLKQWVAEQEESARTSRLEREAEAQRQAQQQAFEQWKALLPYQNMTAYQRAQLEWEKYKWANPSAYQQAMLNLESTRVQQEADYKNWLKQKGISEQQGERATQALITDLLAQPTADKAIDYLVKNQKGIVNSGADINKALQALKYKWPGAFSSSGNILNLLGVNPQ